MMPTTHPTTDSEKILSHIAFNLAESYVFGLSLGTEPDLAEMADTAHSLDIILGGEGEGWWSRIENYRLDADEQARVVAAAKALIPAMQDRDPFAIERVNIMPILRG